MIDQIPSPRSVAPEAPAREGVDVRAIAFTAMNEMRRSGESYEMCARWISERVNSAIALTPRHEAPASTCQKCGGEIAGWLCQQCPAEFRENDAGVLIFNDEAPAEGAGERDDWIEWSGGENPVPGKMVEVRRQYSPRGGVFDSVTPSPSEDHNWKHDREMFGNGAHIIAYRIRARSSAPEARMTGFLATMSDDQRVAAFEYTGPDTHPAAPSADKLRKEVTRDQIMGVVRQYAAPAWCSVDRMADALLAIMSPASTPDALKGDA